MVPLHTRYTIYTRVFSTISINTMFGVLHMWTRIFTRTSFVPLEYHYRTTIQKTSRKQRACTYLWSTTIVPPFLYEALLLTTYLLHNLWNDLSNIHIHSKLLHSWTPHTICCWNVLYMMYYCATIQMSFIAWNSLAMTWSHLYNRTLCPIASTSAPWPCHRKVALSCCPNVRRSHHFVHQ